MGPVCGNPYLAVWYPLAGYAGLLLASPLTAWKRSGKKAAMAVTAGTIAVGAATLMMALAIRL